MSLLAVTKAHYEGLRGDARLQAGKAAQALGLNVRFMSVSRRTYEAIETQWGDARERVNWDWQELLRRYSDIKRLDMAVWTPDDRLVMVALATLSKEALTLRYVEGDPRADCEFKGKRIPLALEAGVTFAQMNGLNEIRIQPLNDALARLYEAEFGFTLVSKKGEVPYWRREI